MPFLAFMIMTGFGVCNARVLSTLALVGIVEIPLWTAAVLVWNQVRRRGANRDGNTGP